MSDFKLKFQTDTGDCTSLKITDVSGVYSATNPQNLTGWNSGLPDMPSIDNVESATLTITTKDTAIPYVIDVFPTLPSIDGAIYTVLPTQIGYTTSIPTQNLKIVYTVTGKYDSGTPFTFSVYCYVGILCAVQCCVDNLNAKAVAKLSCDCGGHNKCKCKCPDEVLTWMKAWALLYGLRKQLQNKQKNMADATLDLLTSICNCQ